MTVCEGQLIELPPGRYDWLYLTLDEQTAAAARVDLPEVWLHYADAVDPEWLYLPPDGTTTRIPVARSSQLLRLRLPRLPGRGVLSLTTAPAVELEG
jgi:hypothetical protein